MDALCLGCMQKFSDEYKICPHCGYVVGTPAEAVHIQPGTLLRNRYVVGKVLGFGGFGVTYIAWDERLEQRVAIKEYLPSEFSTRMPGQTQVTVFGGEKTEQFQDGLSKFVDEAKRLAKFQNESGIVKIFDSFEENSTAYLIMEYLQGETLASYLERMGPLDEQDAVAMLMPVMESLQIVHSEGIIHRDIAPDNIFLTDDGEIKLLDFGAARYATTSHSRSLTVVIKQGYSPEEQYRSRGDHGPHTDVYALSATLYKMITGKIPPDAMERRVKYETKSKDILEDPRKFSKKLSKNRAHAILNALNVRVEDRTPTVGAFIEELNADPPAKRIYGKIKLIDRLRWPLWLKIAVPTCFVAVLTFAILLLSGVINFSKFSQEIVVPAGSVIVPEVEGLGTTEAIERITEEKLFVSTKGSVESEYVPAGKIILQSPTGGAYLNINGTVLLTVSSGARVESPVAGISTVPYVIWDAQDLAISKLKQAGLADPEIITAHDESVSEGCVISQSINAGEKVDEGTKITLTISLGPAAFEMPNVVGMTKGDAETTLIEAGLAISVEYKNDDSFPEGTVLAQSVPAAASVKRGDEIIITVSTKTKPNPMIDVVGQSKDDAERALTEAGLVVSFEYKEDNAVPEGTVLAQSVPAGTDVKRGDKIILTVSTKTKPISVADVVGKEKDAAKAALEEQGFQVAFQEKGDAYAPAGTILSQEPAAGTASLPGTQIVLYVSIGTTPVTGTLQADGTLIISGFGPMEDYSSWAKERNSIKKIIIQDGVTSICNWAFSNCPYTTSITIPDSVTNIGDYAIGGCGSLANITIPNKVTNIGKSAFSGCASLKSITIPSSVISIGGDVFCGCSSLKSITVHPDNPNYSSVDSVLFNKNKTTIIRFPAGKEDTSYNIPDTVVHIGNYAFTYCKSLTRISIPNSVTSIGFKAFEFCTSLENVTIPSSVTSIGAYAFRECDSFTSISIPNGVKSIETYTFSDCGSLASISIPNNVTSIGSFAFENCCSLKSVAIPSSVTEIKDSAFRNCNSLENISIPNGVTRIGDFAFSSCQSLTSITIPNTVTHIAESTFSSCSSLISVTIPNSVTRIGQSAFYGCRSLKSITIPDSVTSIGESAFNGCGLKSITVPNGVISIGNSAFARCYELTSITIPTSVTSIGDSAFWDCESLKSVMIHSDNTTYTSVDSVVFSKDMSSLVFYPAGKTDTSYSIPSGVVRIDDYAFARCNFLKNIVIPNSVTSIGVRAFSESSFLESISIQNSVTNIDSWAFYICESLSSIFYNGTKAQWTAIRKGSELFQYTPLTVIHCTDGDVAVTGS